MRIEQLQAFVEIASSKSINIAADNLYITQPSLSRSLKLLEEELQLTLFERSSDGARLTAAGKTLLPAAQEILHHLDCFKQQASILHHAQELPEQNTLRIRTLQTVIDSLLAFAVESMHQTFPATEFVIEIADNAVPHQLPDLTNYDLFIGLNFSHSLDSAIAESGMELLPIFSDSFSVVVNNQHPLARRNMVDVHDLLDYQLIVHNYDFAIDDLCQKFINTQTTDKFLDIILRSNNSHAISKLLLSSDTALITNNILAANDYIPNDKLTVMPLRNFKYHCFCLYRPDAPQLPLIQQLIKILQSTRLKLKLESI